MSRTRTVCRGVFGAQAQPGVIRDVYDYFRFGGWRERLKPERLAAGSPKLCKQAATSFLDLRWRVCSIRRTSDW
jgi:hypothetical protein